MPAATRTRRIAIRRSPGVAVLDAAGIDMALRLVARLDGPVLAERTARQMDVVWTRDPW